MSNNRNNKKRRKSGGHKLEITIYIVGVLIVSLLGYSVLNLVGCIGKDNKGGSSSVVSNAEDVSVDSENDFSSKNGEATDQTTSKEDNGDSENSNSEKESSKSSSSTTNGKRDYINYTKSGVAELDEWYLRLVNGKNPLAEDFTPSDLTYVYGERRIDSRIVEAYYDMVEAAKNDGAYIYPISTYRTKSDQVYNFNRKVNEVKGSDPSLSQAEAEKQASTVVARPRTSEHECGLAIDFNDVEERFAYTTEGKWLKEHCTEYGFILRYEEDKQHLTGVIWEPWHFRFVGVKHATRMKQLDMCLEEYVDHIKNGGQ